MGHNATSLPLLSIVIASRNRIPYAISAIQSILEMPDPRLELVLQDNSDTRQLELYVQENIKDKRLRYRYTPPPFSPIDNFNAAVELARGEYLCMIGDDDGVNPEIMHAVSWAKANNLDALRPNLIASYFWPDIQSHKSLDSHGGKLFIQEFSGSINFPDANTEAQKCVNNGGLNYLDVDLPKIYHGIIRKKCFDELKNLTGEYFKGLSPDIYGALAVSKFVNSMCSVDYPLTISGTCVCSTAGDSAGGVHVGQLEDAPHLKYRSGYQWDQLIPRFYSVQTIWSESALVALKETHRDDLINKFNLRFLYAQCLISHPPFVRLILSSVHRNCKKNEKKYLMEAITLLVNLICITLRRPIKSLNYRIRSRISNKVFEIGGLENIQKATDSLVAYLSNNNYFFEDLRGIRVDGNQHCDPNKK